MVFICIPSISFAELNVHHFKFQSQHFHKFFAAVSNQPEVKGVKALDGYSRMMGFEDFNDIFRYLSRQTSLIKSFPFPSDESIKQECAEYAGAHEHIHWISEFYRNGSYFYAPSHLPASRQLFDASLRKLQNFAHFPIDPKRDFWQNGDNLAVGLARYFGATDLMEKQLCGIFMVFFDLYKSDLIPGFGFQDVLDLLHPGKFMVSLQLYKTELSARFNFHSNAGSVHSKMINHCTIQDLEHH